VKSVKSSFFSLLSSLFLSFTLQRETCIHELGQQLYTHFRSFNRMKCFAYAHTPYELRSEINSVWTHESRNSRRLARIVFTFSCMLSTVANNFAILDKAYVASLSRALEIVVRYALFERGNSMTYQPFQCSSKRFRNQMFLRFNGRSLIKLFMTIQATWLAYTV